MNNDNPVDATGPVADAPAPPLGAGQAAAEQAAQAAQAKKPAEETGVMDIISGVVDGVCDVADVASGVLSIFDV
jgi:hypothetical protein